MRRSDEHDNDDEDERENYVAYVGCYTEPRQADPFLDERGEGGVPHDDSVVGRGVIVLDVTFDGRLSHRRRPTAATATTVDDDVEVVNPSYLVVSPRRLVGEGVATEPATLLVAGETAGEGTLHAFSLVDDGARLVRRGAPRSSRGPFPCHVAVDDARGVAYVANYGDDRTGGSVVAYDASDGPGRVVARSGNVGSRSDPSGRQTASHAHCCALGGDDGSSLFVADLGRDELVRYRRDDDDGGGDGVVLVATGRLALPPGSGPRSMLFHPDETTTTTTALAAVSLEMAGAVVLVRCDDRAMELAGEPLSLLPDDALAENPHLAPLNGGRWASDVAWSRTGRWLFAANRLTDAISVFELSRAEEGAPPSLALVRRYPSGGRTPRCLDARGQVLLVAHQHSHEVRSFAIDETTGELASVDAVRAPLASCVKLVRESDVTC